MALHGQRVDRGGAPGLRHCSALIRKTRSIRWPGWRGFLPVGTTGDWCRCWETSRLTRLPGWLLALAILIATVQAAHSVTLAWNASADTNVIGYFVYYGAASSVYTNKVAVTGVTRATITGLVEGVTYYFAVTAFNVAGLESTPSNEISYAVPSTLPQVQVQAASGGRATLMVTGQIGHTYDILATRTLLNWTVIGVVTVGNTGSVQFIDTSATNLPARYYRAQETQGPVFPKMRIYVTQDRQVHLEVTGPVGNTYDIQAMQSPTNWTVIGTVTVGNTGSSGLVDTNAAKFPTRLYRARGAQ
jgi:hypothetical protein